MHTRSFPLACIIVVAAGMVLTPSPQALAGSFEVAPTTISLPTSSEPTMFYVTNHGAEPIVVQAEGFNWSQNDKADQLDHADAIIISPPMARLMPDQKQTIRFMVRPDPAATGERAFRLVISEIPDAASSQPHDRVNMLLQFSVPLFVGGAADPHPSIVWSATTGPEGLVLTAHNPGSDHAKISDVVLETADGRKIPADSGAFRYILGASSFTWTIPQPAITAGETVNVHLYDEVAGKPVTTPLLIK